MDNTDHEIVELDMGQGGKKMDMLLEFITNLLKTKKITDKGIGVESFDDGAIIPLPERKIELVVTTDSFTVSPLFFRGGNIGTLAAAGTINDLLMMGAKPIALTLALIIREGLKFSILEEIIKTIVDLSHIFHIKTNY